MRDLSPVTALHTPKEKMPNPKPELTVPIFVTGTEESFQNQLGPYTTGEANSSCEGTKIFFLSVVDTEVHFKNTL